MPNKEKRESLQAELYGYHEALGHPKFSVSGSHVEGVVKRFNQLVEEIAAEFGKDYEKFKLSTVCGISEYVTTLEAMLYRLSLDNSSVISATVLGKKQFGSLMSSQVEKK